MKAAVITGVIAGLVGVGVGFAGSASAEPQVVTKTRTVTKYNTPTACVEALDASENISDEMVKTIHIAADIPMLVPRALRAGMEMDVAGASSINSDLRAANGRLDGISEDVSRYVLQYNAAADTCRSY